MITDQQQSRNSYPQWSFVTKAGEVIELAQFLPQVNGIFMQPSKNMRIALAENYPHLLDEYDEVKAKRKSSIDSFMKLLKKNH